MNPALPSSIAAFLLHLIELLGLETRVLQAEDYVLPAGRNERLVALLERLHATHYLTGPAAKDYLDREMFERPSAQGLLGRLR